MSQRNNIFAIAALLASLTPFGVALAREKGNPNISATTGNLSEIKGTIAAINGNMISVNSGNSSYTLDGTNATLKRKFGAKMLLGDLQVNDRIVAEGTLNGNTLAATKIRDLSLQARNGTFIGTVGTVSQNSFLLNSKNRGLQTINVSAQTVVRKNGAAAQYSDLKSGQNVIVVGVWNTANSNVTANTVHIITYPIHIVGAIVSINANNITLNGSDTRTYSVDITNARVLPMLKGSLISSSALKVGDSLAVNGYVDTVGSTNVKALTVRDMTLVRAMRK